MFVLKCQKKEGVIMGIMFKAFVATLLLIVASHMAFSAGAVAQPYGNENALKGITVAKGIFDIDTGDAKKIEVILKVIGETFDTLKKEGKEPTIVVAFRGPSLRALVAEKETADKPTGSHDAPLTAQINKLNDLGVRFEACSTASRLLNIDVKKLPTAVNMVGNTFISLIGYQAQGYGLVSIQ